MLFALVVPLVLIGLALGRAYGEVDTEFVQAWAAAHGLELTDANRPMQLLLVGGLCLALAMSDIQVFRWTMWVPGFLSLIAALYACLYYGHRAWRVRRSAAPTVEVASR